MGLVEVVEQQLQEILAQVRLVPPLADTENDTLLSLPGELLEFRLEPDLSGGLPFAVPLDIPVSVPGVGGLPGTTSTVRSLLGTALVARVDIRWSVSQLEPWVAPTDPDPTGPTFLSGPFSTSAPDPGVIAPSHSSDLRPRASHFTSPTGLTDRVLALRVVPPLERFGGDLVGSLTQVEVRAHLTVSATVPDVETEPQPLVARQVTAKAALGPFTIVVPSIPVPTVLVMARDRDLRGPALVVVPEQPDLEAITDAFRLLRQASAALEPVRSVAHVAAFLVGVELLLQVLDNEPHIVLKQADRIDNLNDIDLVHKAWWKSVNDIEVEDEVSSLLLLGPPAAGVNLFSRRDQAPASGHLRLRPGTPWFALIRNLHHVAHPTVEPPSGRADVIVEPGDSFADAFSSLRFS